MSDVYLIDINNLRLFNNRNIDSQQIYPYQSIHTYEYHTNN